jgi:hypothetical protein
VGTVTVSDTLPAGLVPTGATGTGWTCGVVAQVVTCTRSDALAAAASYPPITVTVNVNVNASDNVTNVATVSGGGQANTANDTASDLTIILRIAVVNVPTQGQAALLVMVALLALLGLFALRRRA